MRAKIVFIEAGIMFGWVKYVGVFIGYDDFGVLVLVLILYK